MHSARRNFHFTFQYSHPSLYTRELGIGIVPYSPVGRGLFAGKAVLESLPANSFLTTHPRFIGENFKKNKSIYFRMEGIAKKHGCSPAQLAISWVLHQGNDIVPLPGTTKIKNLHDNIGSVRVKLTEEECDIGLCVLIPPALHGVLWFQESCD
ncbi:putative aldo-keto reductase 2 [Capsicum chinense]|nr:putative aldo-keto reductase 2 [Capsicum chinense]